jgi:8-oxo-dGTP pyrophosphatase MutT (NUDIX family)
MALWLPAPAHRALLPLAHDLRHRWRRWRKTPIAGVSVIVTNPVGEVLLLRHSYGPANWALAGGGMGPREAAEDAARREVREELGVELATLDRVAVLEEVISGSPHTAHLFAGITNQPPCPDGREIIEARYFAPDALPAPLGRITSARLAIWQDWRKSQQG